VRRSDADVQTDGGVSSDSDDLFTRTADVPKRTRSERWRDRLNAYVIAPATIIAKDTRGVIGFSILIAIVLLGTVGVMVIPQPTTMQAPIFVQPFTNWKYPLGTGQLGQQIGRQIVHATPAMLKLVISGGLLSVFLGTAIGTLAGYKAGWWDYILMLVSDTVMTIPALALVVVLAAVYSPRDPFIVGLILGINNWPGLARTIRSEVLSMREGSVIETARVMGLSDRRILNKYVIRNLMPYITINFANSARRVIFEAVGLYFLGLLPSSTQNWGIIMQTAYNNSDLTSLAQLHWLLIPMVMIAVFTLGLILAAQSLDRLFNVRLRARHVQDSTDEETTLPE
jgi:peptide/nickel transport system permease protein